MRLVSAGRLLPVLVLLGLGFLVLQRWSADEDAAARKGLAGLSAAGRAQAALDKRFHVLFSAVEDECWWKAPGKARARLKELDAFLAEGHDRARWTQRRRELAERIESLPALDEPAAFERLRADPLDQDLVRVERNLGRWPDADTRLRKILAAGLEEGPAEGLGVVESVARFYYRQGEYDRFVQVTRKGLPEVSGSDEADTATLKGVAQAYGRLGESLLANGRVSEGATAFRRAVEIACEAGPGHHFFADLEDEEAERTEFWLNNTIHHAAARLRDIRAGDTFEGLDPSGNKRSTTHHPGLRERVQQGEECTASEDWPAELLRWPGDPVPEPEPEPEPKPPPPTRPPPSPCGSEKRPLTPVEREARTRLFPHLVAALPPEIPGWKAVSRSGGHPHHPSCVEKDGAGALALAVVANYRPAEGKHPGRWLRVWLRTDASALEDHPLLEAASFPPAHRAQRYRPPPSAASGTPVYSRICIQLGDGAAAPSGGGLRPARLTIEITGSHSGVEALAARLELQELDDLRRVVPGARPAGAHHIAYPRGSGPCRTGSYASDDAEQERFRELERKLQGLLPSLPWGYDAVVIPDPIETDPCFTDDGAPVLWVIREGLPPGGTNSSNTVSISFHSGIDLFELGKGEGKEEPRGPPKRVAPGVLAHDAPGFRGNVTRTFFIGPFLIVEDGRTLVPDLTHPSLKTPGPHFLVAHVNSWPETLETLAARVPLDGLKTYLVR